MMNAVFEGTTPKGSAIFMMNGAKVFAFVGRDVEGIVPTIQRGATVAIELEDVTMRNGNAAKRVTKIQAVGQGAPQTARQVGSVAPSVSGPAQDRDEIIYVCGVVNNYVQNTGDTSVKGLLMATQNAQKAFRVAYRGERLAPEPAPQQSAYPEDMNDNPF